VWHREWCFAHAHQLITYPRQTPEKSHFRQLQTGVDEVSQTPVFREDAVHRGVEIDRSQECLMECAENGRFQWIQPLTKASESLDYTMGETITEVW
jgi:hypothetical protein